MIEVSKVELIGLLNRLLTRAQFRAGTTGPDCNEATRDGEVRALYSLDGATHVVEILGVGDGAKLSGPTMLLAFSGAAQWIESLDYGEKPPNAMDEITSWVRGGLDRKATLSGRGGVVLRNTEARENWRRLFDSPRAAAEWVREQRKLERLLDIEKMGAK